MSSKSLLSNSISISKSKSGLDSVSKNSRNLTQSKKTKTPQGITSTSEVRRDISVIIEEGEKTLDTKRDLIVGRKLGHES